MSFFGIGDLAQNMFLRQRSGDLQRTLSRLTNEISSGRTEDLSAAVKGDFGMLGQIERQLQVTDGFSEARNSLESKFDATIVAFGTLRSLVSSQGAEILSAIGLQQQGLLEARINAGSGDFDVAVRTMNTRIGEQYVYSGVNSNTPPLINSDDILNELSIATAVAVDANQFNQIVDDWFLSTGGGFETLAYQGGVEIGSPIPVGMNQNVSDTPTAAARSFRQTLKELAKVELLSDGAFNSQQDERQEVLRSAGQGMLEASAAIISEEADLGAMQARLSMVQTQAMSLETSLKEARAKVREIDPFEAASELQAVQQQIESLYIITARNSRLTLAEYLR